MDLSPRKDLMSHSDFKNEICGSTINGVSGSSWRLARLVCEVVETDTLYNRVCITMCNVVIVTGKTLVTSAQKVDNPKSLLREAYDGTWPQLEKSSSRPLSPFCKLLPLSTASPTRPQCHRLQPAHHLPLPQPNTHPPPLIPLPHPHKSLYFSLTPLKIPVLAPQLSFGWCLLEFILEFELSGFEVL